MARADNNRKIGPIGRCIYCKADGATTRLTTEHAVPYALGGDVEILQASCKQCSDLTSRFEGSCLRGILMEARTYTGMKTRRPKDRPKTFPSTVTIDGRE